jgi:hypothetical protein
MIESYAYAPVHNKILAVHEPDTFSIDRDQQIEEAVKQQMK